MSNLAPKNSRRFGFTLPEILVSITIVGMLAAVVVPTIAGQIRKGDQSRVGDDLLAIRGAVEQYLSDVRRYPKSFNQLTNAIAASGSALVGAPYGASEAARWHGPYLSKDSASTTTGFNAAFKTTFDTMSLPVSGVTSAAGTLYMLVSVIGIDSANASQIDAMFDDGGKTTGSIRWIKGGTGTDTLRYLLLPVH